MLNNESQIKQLICIYKHKMLSIYYWFYVHLGSIEIDFGGEEPSNAELDIFLVVFTIK